MLGFFKRIFNWIISKVKSGLKTLKYRRASKGNLILIIFTCILYAAGVISFVFGIFGSDEWLNKTIPTSFVLTGIVIPIFLISLAFLIQIIALVLDFYDKVATYTEQSKFLKALENTSVKTTIHRIFLSHLVEEWQKDVDVLSKGRISIHRDYWHACSNFFDYAKHFAECTSAVPLEWWDRDNAGSDKGLLEYKEIQKSKLISRGITVRRTFIFTERPDKDLFTKIVEEQLNDKFDLFYIKLYELALPEELKNNLLTDFLLMDNNLLMVGKFQEGKRSVYYYDFHILSESLDSFKEHKDDLNKVFSDPKKIITENISVDKIPSQLFIRKHRKPIKDYDDFIADYQPFLKEILKRRGDYKDCSL